MFYEYEKIESQLKCPLCNQRFMSPRILPCGKSICENCLEKLCTTSSLRDNKMYIKDCMFCHKSHQAVDETGFTLNEFILKTLELKAEKVYRCPSYEVLDGLLETLDMDLKELISKLQNPELKIKEHFEKIRNQIDLATEILIDKITKFREQNLYEVDSCEKNCIKNFKQFDKKDTVLRLIRENQQKLDKLNSYVNMPKIDEEQVKKLIVEAKMEEYKLKNQLKLINGKLFGKQLVHFDENLNSINSSIIGRLNYENLSVLNDLLDIEKVVEPKIEKVIEHPNVDMALALSSSSLRTTTTNNNNSNQTSLSHDDKYLVLCGQYLKIINESHTLVEIRFDFQPDYFAHNYQDAIFVQHYRYAWMNNRKEKSPTPTLSVYDYNLNLNYECSCPFNILQSAVSEHNIFVQITLNNSIYVYNWHLEKITTIGQDSYVDRPFYFRDLQLKLVKNDRIYMKKMNPDEEGAYWIKIISLTNGQLLNEYYIDGFNGHLFIDALSRTILIDEVFSSLKVYDKPTADCNQAKLILERNLDLANSTGLQVMPDGKFFFIKNKRKINFYSFCT